MFISTLDLFKIGIGPSSSHTCGPMLAAYNFREKVLANWPDGERAITLSCELLGSLAHTGKGHSTDRAVLLGFHGYVPKQLAGLSLDDLIEHLPLRQSLADARVLQYDPIEHLRFNKSHKRIAHPNTLVLSARQADGNLVLEETMHSIGGGFVLSNHELNALEAPLKFVDHETHPFPFDSASSMLAMAVNSKKSIAQMKRENEYVSGLSEHELDEQLDAIWLAMKQCVEAGLASEGTLPGSIRLARRAKGLHDKAIAHEAISPSLEQELLCVYAIAVNEENAAGHLVVTAPTNGAAGVVPAVLYHHLSGLESGEVHHGHRDFLLTAAAIGGLIKHKSSISGAEVGCQGEVGSAAAMAAAGLCAVRGGTPEQVENAAEIALEHHLGMTCDPVDGLVQVPCIERNAFGAIKAQTAANLALMGSGQHMMPLDKCIEAMKETGLEMSNKYKETSLGGLAKSWTEC